MENQVKSKLIVDVIYGSRKMDSFMHAADVFERGKALGTHEPWIINFKDDSELTLERLTKIQAALIEGLTINGALVTFVGLRHKNAPLCYIREFTQTCSDGEKWGMLHKGLKQLGYMVTTGEYMQVLSAKYIIK